jgi:hypothetical protein
VKTITFYTDPGHGWAEIPMAELSALGIADKISPYSYRKGNIAFLEEDCDFFVYMEAIKGQPYEIKEHHTNGDSPIRSYAQYRSEAQ